MTISGIENIGEHIAMTTVATEARVTAKILTTLTPAVLRHVSNGVHALARKLDLESVTSAQMPLEDLHKTNRGDIHPVEIPENFLDDVTATFNERGIAFAVEDGLDGATYLHFRGADADSVRHVIDQVATKVEADLGVKQTPPQTRGDVNQIIKAKAAERARLTPSTPKLNPNLRTPAPKL